MRKIIRLIIVGAVCFYLIGFLAALVLTLIGFGWFGVISSSLDPADAADYLAALFDSSLLRSYAYGLSAVVVGFLFGLLSGAERGSPLVFSMLVGVSWGMGDGRQELITAVSAGVIVFSMCYFSASAAQALRLRCRPDKSEDPVEEKESFEEKVQKIRDRQRLSRRSSPVAKPSPLETDHTA